MISLKFNAGIRVVKKGGEETHTHTHTTQNILQLLQFLLLLWRNPHLQSGPDLCHGGASPALCKQDIGYVVRGRGGR